ncbi:MAG: sugar-binding domain-containing protein [Prolixibacteraceae bacterium]
MKRIWWATTTDDAYRFQVPFGADRNSIYKPWSPNKYGNSQEYIRMKYCFYIICLLIIFSSCNEDLTVRSQIVLNGEWQIAKTDINASVPANFISTVPVPGLVDMASPAIDEQDTSYSNSVYWYKKTFTTNNAKIQKLKISMAKYHTKVFVNGQSVGENVYNFTPSLFNIKPFLKPNGEENELLIAVGCYNNAPDTVMTGNDFEKMKYIPGIYDDVKVIASGYPFISHVQTVPNIINGTVGVHVDLEKSEFKQVVNLKYVVRELLSKKVVSTGTLRSGKGNEGIPAKMAFEAQLSDVNLWSPESPFLYELEVKTQGDVLTTRFGMRSFTPNPEEGAYLLNGKPYYMRGTNVCIFRFFEDPDRGDLPWQDEWVIKLHNRFKEMNWNSIRYCIGFPPARWYEIADSLGFLIQNEYPIWTLHDWDKIYPKVTAEQLANEYRNWLPAHWNHPCIVIWDAQNESVAPITTEAVKMVRDMDLSNRMWENGWSVPANETDPIESHPYLFSNYWHEGYPSDKGATSDLLNEIHIPGNDANRNSPKADGGRYPNPLLINEYAWLWLNRDGSKTTLTDRIYDVCFGKNLSSEVRIDIYTKHLKMLTEYWRAHRKTAGVLHFCGLGYSRPNEPRGQTSDHFIDIKNLTYEPKFFKQVKPAFSPVGLMINYWEKTIPSGKYLFEIYLINDFNETWEGEVKLTLLKEENVTSTIKTNKKIAAVGREIFELELEIPTENGHYQLEAEIMVNGEKVTSVREFNIE